MPASRSGCPQSLSPMRNSNGWPFCQPMAICSTKCRSSRRMSAGTSTTRSTRGVTSSISTLNRAISLIAVFLAGDSEPSFLGRLERQHLVAPIEIADLAVLDHPGEVFAVLQDGDIRDRVFVPHGDVGELSRHHLSDLAVEADGQGVVASRRDDRLHRRVAAVLHENLQLLGVQFAMPRERIVAGVGTDQEFDAELARLVHQLAEQIVMALHAVEIELHLFGADL